MYAEGLTAVTAAPVRAATTAAAPMPAPRLTTCSPRRGATSPTTAALTSDVHIHGRSLA